MFSALSQWWKIIRTAILVVGVLFSFFAFVEVCHVYSILHDVYAPLGYAFFLLITTAFIWFLVYAFLAIRKRPRVLTPPDIEDFDSASQADCVRYCKYLDDYLKRLFANPELASEDIKTYRSHFDQLEGIIHSDQKLPVILEQIRKAEKDSIEPLLSKLDEKAEKEVRNCVRDIMLGVTLSPYRAIDLLIVIYRNAAMVFRIMGIYNSRPLLTEQIMIFRDVLRVVATVNYMNFGQKLMEQFLSRVPYVGGSLDDFAQGIGAGLLTSTAGHGAIYRCRSYRGWNQEIAVQTMSDHVKELIIDVKNIFKKDILPRMKSRVFSTSRSEEIDDPGFWEKTTKGISLALDATDTFIDTVIRKPVRAGSKGTAKVGFSAISKSRKVVIKWANGLWKGTKYISSGTGKGLKYARSKAGEASLYPKKLFRKLRRKNEFD